LTAAYSNKKLLVMIDHDALDSNAVHVHLQMMPSGCGEDTRCHATGVVMSQRALQ